MYIYLKVDCLGERINKTLYFFCFLAVCKHAADIVWRAISRWKEFKCWEGYYILWMGCK